MSIFKLLFGKDKFKFTNDNLNCEDSTNNENKPIFVDTSIINPNRTNFVTIDQSKANFNLVHEEFLNHGNKIKQVDISKDGKIGLSSDETGKILIWDIEACKIIREIRTKYSPLSCIRIDNDSNILIAATSGENNNGGTVEIFDIRSFQHINIFNIHKKWIYDIAISNGALMVATTGLDWITKVWKIENGDTIFQQRHPDAGVNVAFSYDLRRLFSLSSDWSLKVIDLLSGTCILSSESDDPGYYSSAISNNGSFMAVAKEKKGFLINCNTGNIEKKWDIDGKIRNIFGSALEEIIVWIANDKNLVGFHVNSNSYVHEFLGHKAKIQSVAISMDGNVILSADLDGKIGLWKNPPSQIIPKSSILDMKPSKATNNDIMKSELKIYLNHLNELINRKELLSKEDIEIILREIINTVEIISYSNKPFRLFNFIVYKYVKTSFEFANRAIANYREKGLVTFSIISTPHSGISEDCYTFLQNETSPIKDIAYIKINLTEKMEKELIAEVKKGKYNLLLSDAYRLDQKWHLKDFEEGRKCIIDKFKEKISDDKVMAIMFLVNPECMTTLQIDQSLKMINASNAEGNFPAKYFYKEVFAMVSVESSREIKALRQHKDPNEPWNVDMIADNIEKAIKENDCKELHRILELIVHQNDLSVIWGLLEKGIKLAEPICDLYDNI